MNTHDPRQDTSHDKYSTIDLDTTLPSPAAVQTRFGGIEFPPHFEVFEVIGNGAMGIVFRAKHKLLDRFAAIKVCLAICRRREKICSCSIRSSCRRPCGELDCKLVFLAVTTGLIEGAKGRFLRPSRDIINSIMESCFYQAECLDVKSIAFPLLGTGNAGLDREVCLAIMFSFLIRALSRGLTNIEEARIVRYAQAWN